MEVTKRVGSIVAPGSWRVDRVGSNLWIRLSVARRHLCVKSSHIAMAYFRNPSFQNT